MTEKSTINVSDEARRLLAAYCRLYNLNQTKFVSNLILNRKEIKEFVSYAAKKPSIFNCKRSRWNLNLIWAVPLIAGIIFLLVRYRW